MLPGSDENNLGLIGSSNLHGRGRGKIMPKTKPMPMSGQIRRALSTIDKNIITPPSKRTVSEGNSIRVKKKPNVSLHGPITRNAAQAAELKQIEQKEIKEKEEAVEIITIDSDNEESNDFDVPMFVHYTEEKEIEMKDAENDDDKEESVIDIDACDKNNALALVEYIDDIYFFYKSIEMESCVPPNYMDQQPDLNGKMRGILNDWLIEVHYKFELMDETLYLTINIIDRFLAVHQIVRKKLQLVGVTALLLACKYEEVSVPFVDDLILISDKAYTRKEVLDMEKLIVTTLQFNFSLPTPYVFMKRFLKAAQSDKKLEVLSFFIIELCLVEYEMLKYLPSMLAASAIYTAQSVLKGFQEWNKTCEMHSGYDVEQLRECSRKMVVFHHASGKGKLTGVHRKYNTSKFGFAARIEPAQFLL